MTYSEFLNAIGNAFTMFINGLTFLANSLLSNYFIITILGLAIFISLIHFILSLIQDTSSSSSKDLDHINGGGNK